MLDALAQVLKLDGHLGQGVFQLLVAGMIDLVETHEDADDAKDGFIEGLIDKRDITTAEELVDPPAPLAQITSDIASHHGLLQAHRIGDEALLPALDDLMTM